jgi:hypothetical protein
VLDAEPPAKDPLYSSNFGRWPGSLQPGDDFILAMLTAAVPVFTRPT